jgi:hypothetical protein
MLEKEWVKKAAKLDAEFLDETALLNAIQTTDYVQQQLDKGRDYCYIYRSTQHLAKDGWEDYCFMVYTLNEPQTLESSAKRDIVLAENETFIVHRIAVIRNGQIIDKLEDTQLKVLDNEHQSGQGMLTNNKTINLLIKDLHLNDILIYETSVKNEYKEDSVQQDYSKYLYGLPNSYWAYGDYRFEIINHSGKELVYKKNFFRDEAGKVISDKENSLPDGETFVYEQQNYSSQCDGSTEIIPFINFATKATYEELSTYLYEKHYQEYDQNQWQLTDFAPDLVEKLKAEPTLGAQVRYAIEFVQNSVYYLYNADIMDGHKPQTPQQTYETRQGDCKAKTVLLKTILNYLKVDATVLLVNYRADFYLKYYVPSIFNFNHAILKVDFEGKEYFIDATMQDDFGLIENRTQLELMYYLEVKPNKKLAFRKPFYFEKHCVEEKISCTVEKDTAAFKMEMTVRYQNATNMRKYFKSENEKDILSRYNQYTWNLLCLYNKYGEADIPDYFENGSIKITADDRDLNELRFVYQTDIRGPYTYDTKGKAYLQYWDRGFIDDAAREFTHKDFPYWLNKRRIKSEIALYTDQKIDTKEKFTNQECSIQNEYWSFKTKKKIEKNGATMYVDSNPLFSAALEKPAFEEYLKVEKKIRNSNWGLGIDIIKPGFLARLFKK